MASGIKKFIKKIVDSLTNKFPIKNLILFESSPDYSDNTKYVFDEMIKRDINNKYKMIWAYENKENIQAFIRKFSDIKNISAISKYSIKYKFYYKKIAKAFIVSNLFCKRQSRSNITAILHTVVH